MSQQTSINGSRYSFTNVSLQMGGQDIPKGILAGINYAASQDPGIVQGNQVAPIGRTEGYGTGTGDFSMLASEWDDFITILTADGFFPIMSVDFDIIVTYSVNDIDVRTDTLRGCRITNIASNAARGNDALTKDCSISIMRVILNGIDAYADPSL